METKEELIEIPAEQLPAETLQNLIKDFILREGTDYGTREFSLEEKIQQVHHQIKKGDVAITFDQKSETCSLLTRKELRNHSRS